MRLPMKHRPKKPEDPIEMLYQDAKRERDQRHYYRNLILRSISAFFIGSILLTFLEADSLCAFLFALALCGFVALFVFTI